MNPQLKAAGVSFVTTFLVAFLSLSAWSDVTADWVAVVAFSAVTGAARTIVAWLNPGNTEYGIGARNDG